MTLVRNRLLLEADKNESGFFNLFKVFYLVSGVNAPEAERCDNLTVAGVLVAIGTEYEGEQLMIGKKSIYSDSILKAEHVVQVERLVFYPDNFMINYVEINHDYLSPLLGYVDLEKEQAPSSMWMARSIYQLFKIIREWSFMVEEPFNSDHPMATYSKSVIDLLDPPQAVLDEIDSMPDMHLAKFLKGQDDYKLIPTHPKMSSAFKDWIVEITEQYPYPDFKDQF
jgi:hypothetical protein